MGEGGEVGCMTTGGETGDCTSPNQKLMKEVSHNATFRGEGKNINLK